MTIQMLCAFTIAFLFVTAFGKWYIPWLEKEKAGQEIKAQLVQHSGKSGTPTMGGVMFILGEILVCLTLGFPGMLQGHFEHIFVLLFALVFGAIGLLDESQKQIERPLICDGLEFNHVRLPSVPTPLQKAALPRFPC